MNDYEQIQVGLVDCAMYDEVYPERIAVLLDEIATLKLRIGAYEVANKTAPTHTSVPHGWQKGRDFPSYGTSTHESLIFIDNGTSVSCSAKTLDTAITLRDKILDCVARCARMDESKAIIKDIAAQEPAESAESAEGHTL